MNVLMVSAEAVPFAKVGGLADVVGSLPPVLHRLGVDARVMMPAYGFLDRQKYRITHLFTFQLPRPNGTATVEVHTTVHNGIPFYFLKSWPFFGEEGTVYTEWNWDMPRFIFFNQAVMAAVEELRERLGWQPHLLHVNDWHTGLIPFLLEANRSRAGWRHAGVLLTIHNINHQGPYAGGWLWEQGIPGRHQPDLVYQDLTDNLLAIAIAYADKITTVSPRYATEIQYPHGGYGLEGLIRARSDDLRGILNGIDTLWYDPDSDPHITSQFNAHNVFEQRPPNKRDLQAHVGLPVRDDVPVIGMVTRIDAQKGIGLAVDALYPLLASENVQFVAVGTGDPALSARLKQLEYDFSWASKARTVIAYAPETAQRVYAGCDLFLMPSHFEPCGIGQMIAMRYGALPVVRETGGLADTVQNYDDGPADRGSGFVFQWETADAVLGTLRWAIDTYRTRQRAWQRMQQRAMLADFGWDSSARQYADLYRQIIEQRRP